MPRPPETVATHIERVDSADFFGVLNDDALCLRGNLVVPPLTIVELRSQRATVESLSRAAFQPTPSVAPNYLSVDLPNCERLRTLALEWAGDRPAGYAQIDAIVRQLKAHCELEPSAVVPADAANAVTHFLFNSRRGPDYLFASSAVLLLRSIGYPARLCSGFYASPERYDRQSRSTPVLKCDVHVWAEVCCRGRYWLPIEPTPGYETLGPDRSLWQRVVAAVVVAVDWCVRRWPLWLASSLLLGVAAWQWRWCCDCVLFVLWWLSRWASPARHVLATVRYWELRAWLAGQRRPAGKALSRWHAELRKRLAVPTIEPAFATVLAAAQRVLYAPTDTRESPITRSADEQKKWRTLCAATLQHWTVRQLRRATESHL